MLNQQDNCTIYKLAPEKLGNPTESTQDTAVELLTLIDTHQ